MNFLSFLDKGIFVVAYFWQTVIVLPPGILGSNPSPSLCETEIQDLSYVVNHAVKDPLDIDLDFSSKRKSVQALAVLDIRKNRLGDCDPLMIDISSPLRVYFGGHLFDQIARSGSYGDTPITSLDKVPFDATIL